MAARFLPSLLYNSQKSPSSSDSRWSNDCLLASFGRLAVLRRLALRVASSCPPLSGARVFRDHRSRNVSLPCPRPSFGNNLGSKPPEPIEGIGLPFRQRPFDDFFFQNNVGPLGRRSEIDRQLPALDLLQDLHSRQRGGPGRLRAQGLPPGARQCGAEVHPRRESGEVGGGSSHSGFGIQKRAPRERRNPPSHSALDELHGADGAQEEDRGHLENGISRTRVRPSKRLERPATSAWTANYRKVKMG